MITMTALSGEWKLMVVKLCGFSAFGYYSANCYVGYLIPIGDATIATRTIKGAISTGRKNFVGDRSCDHVDFDGELFRGTKFTSTKVDVGDPQIGPNFVNKYTCPVQGGSIVFHGYMEHNLSTKRYEFPDSRFSWGLGFTNVYATHEFLGDILRVSVHYDEDYKGDPRKSFDDTYDYLLDLEHLKYKRPEYPWSNIPSLLDTSYVSGGSNINFTMKEMSRIFDRADKGFPVYDDRLMYGDLVRRCANDAQTLDMNNIENLAQLTHVVREMKDLLSLLKGKATLKSAAKLYLAYKYGVRLTVSDFMTMYEETFRKVQATSHQFRWSRAMESTAPATSLYRPGKQRILYNYKIYYSPYDSRFAALCNRLWNAGLFPSLQNAWDLIPFSFVVDWFVKIGDSLSAYDATTFWSTNGVFSTVYSKKTIIDGLTGADVSSTLADCTGTVSLSKYARYTDNTCMPTSYFNDDPDSFHNYAELVSLIIARKR